MEIFGDKKKIMNKCLDMYVSLDLIKLLSLKKAGMHKKSHIKS